MLERFRSEDDERADAKAELDRMLMRAFCRTLEMSPPRTPVEVVAVMAQTLGSIYRQVADSHAGGQCACGWYPSTDEDIEVILSALKRGTQPRRPAQLMEMKVLGRA